MKLNPVTMHIAAMADKLDDAPRRAAYMTVKELYKLQQALKNRVSQSLPECKEKIYQILGGYEKMCPEEMRKHIIDRVEEADETSIEQIYWLLFLEFPD